MIKAGGENTSQKTNGAQSSIYKCRSQILIKKNDVPARKDLMHTDRQMIWLRVHVPFQQKEGSDVPVWGKMEHCCAESKDFTLIRAYGFNTVILHRNHTPAAHTILIS